MARNTRTRTTRPRDGLAARRRIVDYMLMQAIHPSGDGWTRWVKPMYERHPEMNAEHRDEDAPKIVILLRGWPTGSSKLMAEAMRIEIMNRTDALPTQRCPSIALDYYGYDANPRKRYRSWFEVILLMHPDIGSDDRERVWGWTTAAIMSLATELPTKPKVLAPPGDETARRAGRSWGLKVRDWPEHYRESIERA